VKDDDGIEGHIEWKEKKKGIQRVKDAMLGIGEEGVACELIGIPQRKMTMLYALYPEESRGYEIGTQIPLEENISPGKEVIKKDDGGKEKGQTSQDIG
jgi:hypothetical protein